MARSAGRSRSNSSLAHRVRFPTPIARRGAALGPGLWTVAVLAGLVVRPLLAVVLAATVALAAHEIARERARRRQPSDDQLAPVLAAGVTLAALIGVRAVGATLLGAVVLTLVLARRRERARLEVAAANIPAWLPTGVAGAATVVVAELELGAALVLVAVITLHDLGAYLVGVDARGAWEGPVAGWLAVVVLAAAVAALRIPPFEPLEALILVTMAGGLALLGPLAGSVLVPDPRVRLPGLRRIDVVLLLGPAWVYVVETVAS